MDLPMSQTVRENFISLMVDCDHRQNLLQDLILSNNQIKYECGCCINTNNTVDSLLLVVQFFAGLKKP